MSASQLPTPGGSVLSTLECLNNVGTYVSNVYFPGLRRRILDMVTDRIARYKEDLTIGQTDDPELRMRQQQWEYSHPAGSNDI